MIIAVTFIVSRSQFWPSGQNIGPSEAMIAVLLQIEKARISHVRSFRNIINVFLTIACRSQLSCLAVYRRDGFR